MFEKIHTALRQVLPSYLVMHEPNPLNPTLPTGVPLKVLGRGMGGPLAAWKGVTGFDQINKGENDPYYVIGYATPGRLPTTIGNASGVSAMRMSVDHTVLFTMDSVDTVIDRCSEDDVTSISCKVK